MERSLCSGGPCGWRDSAIGVLVALVAFALMAIRAHFGVDFTDEAFYASLPYRFALGDRPFVDELHIIQTSGIVLTPLVRAFLHFNDGIDGVVIFFRFCHLALMTGLGTAAYLFLRRHLGSTAALLTATASAVFVPYNLPSLSYNTLTGAALTLGTVALLTRLVSGGSARYLLAAGMCFGLSVVLYPPGMLLPALTALAVVVITASGSTAQRMREAAWYVTGGIIAAMTVLVPMFRAGIDAVTRSLEYTASIGSVVGEPSVAGRFLAAGVSAVELVSSVPLFVAACVVTLLVQRMGWSWWVYLLTPALVVLVFELGFDVKAMSRFAGLAVSALTLLTWWGLRGRKSPMVRRAFLATFPIAFSAGLAFALTSTNKADSFGVGLLPMLIPVAMALRSIGESDSDNGLAGSRRPDIATLFITIVSCAIVFQFASVYRDDPISSLDVRVASGPYRGLYTTSATVRLLSHLDEDLTAVAGQSGRILAFDRFPAGYLFTAGRPASPTTWVGLGSRDSAHGYVIENLRSGDDTPEAVLYNTSIRRTLSARGPAPGGLLKEYIEAETNLVPVIVREDYVVYGPRDEP